MVEYIILWNSVNQNYFGDTEKSFTQFVLNEQPSFRNKLLSWTLGSSDFPWSGIVFYDTKKQPTIRAVSNSEIEPYYIPEPVTKMIGNEARNTDDKGGSDLNVGDIINSIDRVEVSSVEEFYNELSKKEKDDIVKLIVKDGKKIKTVFVKLQ